MAKAKKTTEISLTELLEAGCHFGHQARRWNPKMSDYIYETRQGIHVLDLVKTKEKLEAAIEFLKTAAGQGKRIVFVGTKRQAQTLIKEAAEKAGVSYVIERWIGGLITNWEQVQKNIKKFGEMKGKREKGDYKGFTKKEQLLIDREINRLEKIYGGLANLDERPEVLFVVDAKHEEVALKEARRKEIASVGIIDTNSDPDSVDWVIPANDDAVGSLKLIIGKIGEAVAEGKKIFEKKPKKLEI